ncbi:hypothetical protein ACQHIH_15965 [Xanthomonas sontii]|uniref:hypothetical protein n=1 Tax=Xanthomonas sontii TaxID=2650745 RepID=UPI003F83C168
MATLYQLEQALRAADAAGNTEDAKRLAQAYADMRKQQSGPADFSQVKSHVDSTANDRVAPVTDSMSGYEKFMAGAGKSVADSALGVGQVLSSPIAPLLNPVGGAITYAMGQRNDLPQKLAQRVAEQKQLDAPLMSTGAGIAGNIAGTAAQILGPGALARGTAAAPLILPRTIAGNALQGLAVGAVQPAANNEERGLNSLIGLAGGGLGAVAGKAAAATIGAGKNALASLLGRGLNSTDAAAGQAIVREATNPNAITFTPSAVPGVNRTLGEATLDPGLMALENTMRASRRGTFEQIDNANNAARVSQLERIAGTPQDMAAAEAARDAGTATLRDRAFAEGEQSARQAQQARALMVGTDPAIKALREQVGGIARAKSGNPAVQSALNDVSRALENSGDSVAGLYNVRQYIGDLLSGKAGGDKSSARAASSELLGIRELLDKELASRAPSFPEYLDAYRQASKPINRMQTGQELIDRGSGAVADALGNPRLAPAAFSKAASDLDSIAAKATGFKKAKASEILTSDDINAINAIQEDMRRQFARQSSATVGSQTAERLDIGNRLMQRGLMRAVPVVKDVAAFVEQQASDRLKERLAYLMANPAEAKRVLAALDKQSADSVRRVLSQLSFTTGTAAATSASNARGTTPP